jgi:hypothetical protein
MPGTSAKTRVHAVRLTAFAEEVLDALAEKEGCSRSEAHKRALQAGCTELLGAMKVAKIRERHRAASKAGDSQQDQGVNNESEEV